MSTQLLNGEIEEHATSLGGGKLILTNKRLIYNNSYMGINELRSIEVVKVRVKKEKFSISNNLHKQIALIVGLLIVIILAIRELFPNLHGNDIGFWVLLILFGGFFGVLTGILVGFVITLLLRLYLSATAETVIMTSVEIIRTNNTYFINFNTNITQFDGLKKFENVVNNLIYK